MKSAGRRPPGNHVHRERDEGRRAACVPKRLRLHRHVHRPLKDKEHLGYIIDRTGFEMFRSVVLDGIESDPPVQVLEPENPGYVYPRRE